MPETAISTASLPVVNPKEPQNLRFAIASLSLVLIAASTLAYSYRADLPPSLDYLLLLAVASIVILLGMSGLYYYAYNFYHDDFYLFAALGWLANAIYIIFEGFFPGARGETRYGLWIDLFMIISLVPFYIAGTLSKRHVIHYKSLTIPAMLVIFWVVVRYLPNLDLETKFSTATVVVIFFAFYSLRSSGRSLAPRLNPTVHGPWAKRLVFTFYGYAYLQFIYLVTLIPHLGFSKTSLDNLVVVEKWALRLAFGAALVLKILNSVSALSIIRHDFTDLRVRLIQSEEELSRRSRFEDLGILTASILHEILNPLGVIETRVNLMRDSYQKTKDILADLDSIEEQRQKIFNATRIIPYIRAEPEFYEGEMEKINVGDLIRKSIKDLKDEINISNITLRVENKEGVFFARAVPHMMEEAFINILKNSVEAIRDTRRNNGLISIEMKIVSKTEQLMVVDVTDNGSGIPSENILKVTAPLFSTRKGQKPNSGLGLFVTDQIIKIHHGKLAIHSSYGAGTTVSLTLPMLEFRKR